jgi:prepilin-type N-terminal cleavage/methylation domain-containing protein
MNIKNLYQRAFTLIELLVVISIISLITSIALAALQEAREKAIATKYVQGVLQLRNAFELYKASTGIYPNEGTPGYLNADELNSFLVPTYISSIPEIGDESGALDNFGEPLSFLYSTGFYSNFQPDLWSVYQGGSGDENDYNYILFYTCGGQKINSYIALFYSDRKLNFSKLGYVEDGVLTEDVPYGGPFGDYSIENWYCVSG